MSDDAAAETAASRRSRSRTSSRRSRNQIGLVGAVKPFLREVRKSHAPDYGTGAGEAERCAHYEGDVDDLAHPQAFFYKYDIDGNSKMSINELNLVFADIGQRLKPAELNTLFAAFDKDKSGEIVSYNDRGPFDPRGNRSNREGDEHRVVLTAGAATRTVDSGLTVSLSP